MLETIIIASGVVTAFGLLFFGLFMRFGRDWNDQ
jgi:hypothetical protein